MRQPDAATLVHAVGFVTGIALYAMLAAMVLRARADDAQATAGDRRLDQIPLATAALGLLWNVGGLVVYGAVGLVPTPGGVGAMAALAAVAFSALGFLPAVVVHAALQGERSRTRLAFTGVAYALSATAAVMHAWAAVEASVPSRPALRLLSFGYAVLLAALALRLRRHPGARGPLAAVALAAFAVMASHLGHHGEVRESVAAELLGHHASLALALVILYQDFRFALADLFLKRVLAAVALVSFALAAYLVVAPFVAARLAADPSDPQGVAVLLALWIATAVAYPAARRGVSAFVDRVVLRRVDYAALRVALQGALNEVEAPEAVLEASCDALGPALSADRVTWEAIRDPGGLPATPTWSDARHLTAIVPIPTADAPAYRLVVGGLRGGRRLLSDDVALLEAVGMLAARRIDALRVAHERYEREAREQEIGRLASEAELRALRAQINPHFLFNALTTIGYLLQEAPDRALGTLLRLTGLLRAVLKPPAGSLVPLGEEMEIVEAYLAIERARFEERLRVTIDVPEEVRGLGVPPLLLQPLVENAVKHGVSTQRAGGEVRVQARVERAGGGEERLHLSVVDTGAGVAPAELARRRREGVGLANVERRLERIYGAAAAFAFRSAPGAGTSVELWLPLAAADAERARLAAPGRDARPTALAS